MDRAVDVSVIGRTRGVTCVSPDVRRLPNGDCEGDCKRVGLVYGVDNLVPCWCGSWNEWHCRMVDRVLLASNSNAIEKQDDREVVL